MDSKPLRRVATRIRNGRFCTLEVELRTKEDGKDVLSICGVEGEVKTSAGRYDDVVGYTDAGKALVATGFGQITDELAAWFPESVPWLPYHLNDMRPGCSHQRGRGETWKTHPSAKCPDCGYSLGSAWLYEELPEGARAWVESVPTLGTAEVKTSKRCTR